MSSVASRTRRRCRRRPRAPGRRTPAGCRRRRSRRRAAAPRSPARPSAGIRSASPGSTGAQQGVQAGGVRGEQRTRAPGRRGGRPAAMASAMVCDGNELQRDRDVAEGEVEVDEADLRLPPSASAAARLVETVVLPQPPLAENTVTTRPSGAGSPRPDAAEPLRELRGSGCRPRVRPHRSSASRPRAPRPQGVREHADVDPPAQQHDPDVGRLSRRSSVTSNAATEVDVGADDEQALLAGPRPAAAPPPGRTRRPASRRRAPCGGCPPPTGPLPTTRS